MDTRNKTIVFITGANSGIGYETVKALLQSTRSYHIFLGSRSLERGHEAATTLRLEVPESLSSIEVIEIDVSSDESIAAAYGALKGDRGHIDVLVNNAGQSLDGRARAGTLTVREAWNYMYDVNVTGTQILTNTLAPLLIQSTEPRLLFLGSGLAQLETMHKGFYPGPAPGNSWPKKPTASPDGYRTSKTALNMVMLNWYWTLKEDGVKVWSINPGFLATNLGNSREKLKAVGAGDPSLGGILIKQVIEGERDSDVGRVIRTDGVQPF